MIIRKRFFFFFFFLVLNVAVNEIEKDRREKEIDFMMTDEASRFKDVMKKINIVNSHRVALCRVKFKRKTHSNKVRENISQDNNI